MEGLPLSHSPRLTSVMGVARALLVTLGVEDTVDVLVAEFGWDVAFQALALLRGAEEAFARCWEVLLTGPVARELDHEAWASGTAPDAA